MYRQFKTPLLALAVILAPLHTLAEWQYLGLAGHFITKIKLYNGNLYTGTDNGIYRKANNSADTLWMHLGLEERLICDLTIISNDSILASLWPNLEDSIAIFRTIDGGGSWHPYQSNWPPGKSVWWFDCLPNQRRVIYAVGWGLLARTDDGGATWQGLDPPWPLSGEAINFIKVDTCSLNIIWAGGESMIFAPFLFKSINYGDDFKSLDIPYTGDDACYDIAIDVFNSQIVYIGREGSVMKTTDGGDSWEMSMDPFMSMELYIYGLETDPVHNSYVYAGGYRRSGDIDLPVIRSIDGGENWAVLPDAPVVQDGAMDIKLARNGNANEIYIATYADGVWKFTDTSLPPVCGDVDGNETVNMLDILVLIAYLYKGGPAPELPEVADVNSDYSVDMLDILHLVSYLYKNGPRPECIYE